MTTKRLTRPEQRERNRSELLTAARQMFVREGYLRSSLEAIADAAGFSKGAVYSNFPSKEALFLELLEAKLLGDARDMAGLLSTATTVDGLIDALRAHLASRVDILDFTAIAVEFMSQALPDGEAGKRCRELYRHQRAVLTQLIAQLFAAAQVTPPPRLDEAAAACTAMTLGLSLQRQLDPEAIDASLWASTVTGYLANMISSER